MYVWMTADGDNFQGLPKHLYTIIESAAHRPSNSDSEYRQLGRLIKYKRATHALSYEFFVLFLSYKTVLVLYNLIKDLATAKFQNENLHTKTFVPGPLRMFIRGVLKVL